MLFPLLLSLALAGCAGHQLKTPSVPAISDAQQQAMIAALESASAAQDRTENQFTALAEKVANEMGATRKAAEAAQDVRQPLMAFGGPDLTQPNPATAKRPVSTAAALRPLDPAPKQILERIGRVGQQVGDASAQIAGFARTVAELSAQIEALKNQPQSPASSALEDQGSLGILSAIATLLAFVLGRVTKKGVPK